MQAFDLKKNLSLIYLIICGILTAFAVIFSFYTYVSWSEPVPTDPEILQIKLPVMKWAEYSTLSKRYKNGIVVEDVGAETEAGARTETGAGVGVGTGTGTGIGTGTGVEKTGTGTEAGGGTELKN